MIPANDNHRTLSQLLTDLRWWPVQIASFMASCGVVPGLVWLWGALN